MAKTQWKKWIGWIDVGFLSLIGLSLELYIEQNEYVRELSESAGVKLIIHEQNKMIFPDDEGFYLSPGFITAIALQKVNIYTQYTRIVKMIYCFKFVFLFVCFLVVSPFGSVVFVMCISMSYLFHALQYGQ